jgi:hypothetical protein
MAIGSGIIIDIKRIRRGDKMSKFKWYLKQLLPLAYKAEYGMNGKRHSCEWRMWMGRCFAIDDRILGG